MSRLLTLAVTAGALLWAGGARAQEGGADRFSLSGFGTIGVVHSSEHLADFVGSINQPTGTGGSHGWDYGSDSTLGLQLDARATDRLTAVVQVVARHQYDNSYVPQLEWANLRLRVTPDFSLRVGRIALPIFMVSDSRLVGYANPWLRPPPEIYNTGPVTNNDGIDVAWRGAHGGVSTTLQLIAGRTNKDFPGGIEVTGRHMLGANATLERGATTLQLHYTSAAVDVASPAIDQLFGGYTQLGEGLAAVPPFAAAGADTLAFVAAYRPIGKLYTALSVGVNHDPGPWFATGEWVREHLGVALSDSHSGYLTLGVRTHAFTPYLTWAAVTTPTRERPVLPTTLLPAPYGATMAVLDQGFISGLSGFWGPQHSVSLGVRYELTQSADLKLQLDHILEGASSSGFLIDTLPGYVRGGTVNVIGAGVDFVF
jgi:hypothetical protein